jgi:hypothetical protein
MHDFSPTLWPRLYYATTAPTCLKKQFLRARVRSLLVHGTMKLTRLAKLTSPAAAARKPPKHHASILEKLRTLPTERKGTIWECCSKDSLVLPRIEFSV